MTRGEKPQTSKQRIEELEARLQEAEETLEAIRSGEVDALVISGPEGEQIFTLKTAEHPYRVLVEAMSEGAVTLSHDGTILYCNQSFAALLKTPSERVFGSTLSRFIAPADHPRYEALLRQCQQKSAKGGVTLIAGDESEVSTLLSLSPLPLDGLQGVSIVVTDLTEQKRQQELVASENLLRSILDQAAEATIVCDGHGQIIHASRRAHELCGCNPVLRHFDELLPLLKTSPAESPTGSGEERRRLSFSAILESKELRGVEATFHRADGQVLDLLLSAGLVLDLKGKMLGCVVTLIDITERKRVEAALQNSEARLRAIFDGTYEFIGLLSPDGTILEANRAALEWAGCRRGQIIGRPFWETPWWTNTQGASEQVLQAIKHAACGEFIRQEVSLRSPAGEVCIFDFSLHPICDESGKVVLLVPEGRDITEKVTARKDLEAANRLKDEFLATLSHELRNPLNSIVGYADVLLRSREARQVPIIRQAAETIHRNAEAQAQLINDLLDLSRLQTGKLAVDRQPMTLAPVLGDAVESVRGQAGAKELKLDVDFPAERLVVNADPVRVQQIVWNLVNNAVKFTPKGGRVSVHLSREGKEAKLVVEDTGQGIDPGFLPHVFEMFRQSDAGTTRSHGGMGIGLALVRQLTELHGGKVEANSEGPGRGARFTVRLPLHTAVKFEQKAPMIARTEDTLPGARILVVDDSADSLELLRFLLTNEGAMVTTGTNGEEGLRLAKGAEFDLIISDISMPVMDGYDFLKNLQADQLSYANIPAIALTGFGRDEDVEQARQAGFTTHLTKPLDFDHLLQLARVTLRK